MKTPKKYKIYNKNKKKGTNNQAMWPKTRMKSPNLCRISKISMPPRKKKFFSIKVGCEHLIMGRYFLHKPGMLHCTKWPRVPLKVNMTVQNSKFDFWDTCMSQSPRSGLHWAYIRNLTKEERLQDETWYHIRWLNNHIINKTVDTNKSNITGTHTCWRSWSETLWLIDVWIAAGLEEHKRRLT